jgi:Retron-type reverse transcriptase
MANAEYLEQKGCLQRDSAEHEEYAGAQSAGVRESRETDGADLLERILSRDNLNRAYKRVRANKGAPGIDGMTVEDALPWLQQHRKELLESIRAGKYKPQPDITVYPTGTSPCTYAIEPPYTERYARRCGRSLTQRMGELLPDCIIKPTPCVQSAWRRYSMR